MIKHVGFVVEDCDGIEDVHGDLIDGIWAIKWANNGKRWQELIRVHGQSRPSVSYVVDLMRKLRPEWEGEHLVEYREDLSTGEYEPMEDLEVDDEGWGDCR